MWLYLSAPPCTWKFKPVRTPPTFAGSVFFAPRFDLCADPVERSLHRCAFQRTLPYDNEIPAGVAPCLFVAVVALDVSRPLLHPERDVRLRHGRILASMPVPEASAHVYYRLGFGNHNVRFSRISLVTYPEPPAESEKSFADKDFRHGVLAADLRHQPTALLWSYRIHLLISLCNCIIATAASSDGSFAQWRSSAFSILATAFSFVFYSSQFLHVRLIRKPRLLLAPHVVKRLVPFCIPRTPRTRNPTARIISSA